MSKNFLSKVQNVFNKGDAPGMRSKKIDIISRNDYESVEKTESNYSDEEGMTPGSSEDGEQYDKTETLFIKLSGARQYDLKIEHFDDMI